jgi:hypothetical protein
VAFDFAVALCHVAHSRQSSAGRCGAMGSGFCLRACFGRFSCIAGELHHGFPFSCVSRTLFVLPAHQCATLHGWLGRIPGGGAARRAGLSSAFLSSPVASPMAHFIDRGALGLPLSAFGGVNVARCNWCSFSWVS